MRKPDEQVSSECSWQFPNLTAWVSWVWPGPHTTRSQERRSQSVATQRTPQNSPGISHTLAPHRPMVACLMSRRRPTCWMAAGACCTRPGPVPRRPSRTPSRYVSSCAPELWYKASNGGVHNSGAPAPGAAGPPVECVIMRRQCCHIQCKAPQPLAPGLAAQYRQQQHQLVCLGCTAVRWNNRALTIPIPLTMPACANAACAHAACPNRVSTASLCSKTWTCPEASPPSPMSLISVPVSVTSG